MFPAKAAVKKKIAFTNLQTTGSTGREDDKSSFIWIELEMGYPQEMSYLCPKSRWGEESKQLAGSSEGISNN